MIITNDANRLSIPCQPATMREGLEIIKKLDEELKRTERDGNPGIGLAANQIGINKQVCIVRTKKSSISLINPFIISFNKPIIVDGEGCLSFPDKTVKTRRYHEIHVIDDLNEEMFLTGLEAICVQHEVDHLNGITMMDREIDE